MSNFDTMTFNKVQTTNPFTRQFVPLLNIANPASVVQLGFFKNIIRETVTTITTTFLLAVLTTNLDKVNKNHPIE